MRVPLSWLHEYVKPDLDAAALAERLALTGTEVERVVHHGVLSVEGFVIGRVLSAERHPDADRLNVCRVDLGGAEPAQIVCGAPNVAAGQTVAVAQPGAVMPDGTRLRKAKLRGVESAGMILSEPELEIGVERAGIMVLGLDGGKPAPGTPLADVLPLATDVLELEVTPNRPDCLGVYGVAREAHAATGAPLAPAPWSEDVGTGGPVEGAAVAVETDRCKRFMARVFEGVTVGPSPPWLKARLMAAGMRPISNVVDVTNYAMLLTGQPLHAFDLDRVAGGRLVVRDGQAGDELETLDGERRRLDPEMVVICDADGPTSLAGVMGGARSEVHAGTTRVLLESAVWDGPNIQRTSTRLGLRSEASGRYEKGLAPEQAQDALALATRLLVELCGARVAPGTIDVDPPGGRDRTNRTIRLRDARVSGLLGAPVARERSAEILSALGFLVDQADDGLDVTVPAFRRNDVTREADLIEEVARIDGVDKLPATLPASGLAVGRLTPAQRLRRRAADTLAGAGLHEAIGWSWSAPELADRLRLAHDDPRRAAVVVENPMSADHAQMRTTLLGSLLDVARRNVTHGTGDVAIFEAGAVYRPVAGRELPDEPYTVGVLLTGAVRAPSWREPAPPAADFFAAKGVLAALLGALRVAWALEPAGEPFMHPGRAAAIVLGGADGERIGWIGELHPSVAAAWELSGAVAAFELDLDRAIEQVPGPVRYTDYTSFPEVRQDLAVVVPQAVAAAEVVAAVRAAGGPLLARVEVFDVYRGAQVGADEVSLALRLAFRSPERTLTDEEVAERRAAIEAALAEQVGGRIRA
ncbi:MAG: phenylalanine--tRNA ligase subunit beta [Actinobacteria bacterium]|nr:phenylalanine--tRNA ligase subunit beta [Actinomycetota bacterium]